MKNRIMNLSKVAFKTIGILLCVLILHGCDGPDYGKMRPSRMDIAGAKSIGFIDGTSASRGDALSSGLYKIDANGNITAVAVYFTEEDNGKQTKHEGKVKLLYAYIKNAANDFIYFSECQFVDNHGEYIYGLPKKILVRKSDGKMWNLDKESTGVEFPVDSYEGAIRDWQFYQDNNGTLYYASKKDSYSADCIYKLNLNTEPATIEQITANVDIYPPFGVDSKGLIVGPLNRFGNYSIDKFKFAWQNSGFQDLSELPNEKIVEYNDIDEGLKVKYTYPNDANAIVSFHEQYYLLRFTGSFYSNFYGYGDYYNDDGWHNIFDYGKYPFLEFGICNKISVGNKPGSVTIDQSETVNLKNDNGWKYRFSPGSVLVSQNYILISGICGGSYWITALNPETNEWKWLMETPEYMNLDNSYSYNNRFWCPNTIDDVDGISWFNPNTLETGFVKYNTTLPSYVKFDKYYDGKVIYSGVNSADSHIVKVAIDLMTGEAVTDDEAPEYLFSTLVSLN